MLIPIQGIINKISSSKFATGTSSDDSFKDLNNYDTSKGLNHNMDHKRYAQRISSNAYKNSKRPDLKLSSKQENNDSYVRMQNPAIPFPQSQKHYK